MTVLRTIPALACCVALALTGCTQRASSDDAPAAAAGSGSRPTPIKVVLDAQGYRSDAGTAPPGWIRVEFRNETETVADISLVRLEGARTLADLDHDLADPRALGTLGDSYYFQGGATMVGPGESATFRAEVFPGRFVLGSVAEMAEGAGRPATLEIGNGDPALDDPRTDTRITFEAYSFGVDKAITKGGKKSVTLFGEGPDTHELRVYKVQPGVPGQVAFDTVVAMKGAPASATAQLRPVAGISALNAGYINVNELALDPGEYVLACLLTEAKTSKSYAELGMRQLIEVIG